MPQSKSIDIELSWNSLQNSWYIFNKLAHETKGKEREEVLKMYDEILSTIVINVQRLEEDK